MGCANFVHPKLIKEHYHLHIFLSSGASASAHPKPLKRNRADEQMSLLWRICHAALNISYRKNYVENAFWHHKKPMVTNKCMYKLKNMRICDVEPSKITCARSSAVICLVIMFSYLSPLLLQIYRIKHHIFKSF